MEAEALSGKGIGAAISYQSIVIREFGAKR
jgi:hypothetical protein